MNLNNKVIKVLNPEHGKKVIEFFINNGVKKIIFNSYWFTDIGGCEIIELTPQDISEGKGVGILPHLIRIKK